MRHPYRSPYRLLPRRTFQAMFTLDELSASGLESRELCRRLCILLRVLTNATAVQLLLRAEDGAHLESAVCIERGTVFRNGMLTSIPIAECSLLQSNIPRFITGKDTSACPPLAPVFAAGYHHALATPIHFQDETLGMILVFDTRPPSLAYRSINKHLSAAFAVHIATVVRNERLVMAAREEENRLRAVLNTVPMGIILVAGDTLETATLVEANAAAETLVGKEIPIGLPLREFTNTFQLYGPERRWPLAPEALPSARALAHRAILPPEEVHLRLPNGEWRVLQIGAAALPPGHPASVTIALQDITACKQAEEAMRSAEERLRLVIQNAPISLFVLDSQGVYTLAEGKGREPVRAQRGDVVGRSVFEVFQDVPAMLDGVRQALAGKDAMETLEINGTVFDIRYRPLRDSAGKIRGVIGVAMDITAHYRAEEAQRFLSEASLALTASMDYAERVRNLARAGIPFLGDWCFLYLIEDEHETTRVDIFCANPAREPLAQELKRYTPPSLPQAMKQMPTLGAGQAVLLSHVPDSLLLDLATGPEHLKALRELGARSSLAIPLMVRGRILGLLLFVMAESGRHYRAEDQAVAKEFANRAAMAMENALLFREAKDASAARDHFLGVLSHELRNPLTPILAGVELLKPAVTGDARAQRTLEIIERNARLQARLISDLLDFSRIVRGKIQIQRTALALDMVARAAVEALRDDAEAAGLTLESELTPGLWVFGDYERLNQVISHLLSNAIKFTPSGGTVRVRLTSEAVPGQPDRNQACLVVEDTGSGIEPEVLQRLFQMFQQGVEADQRRPGLGIGLALVKLIVEMHGGRVWAESEGPGKGSRFTVALPLMEKKEEVDG